MKYQWDESLRSQVLLRTIILGSLCPEQLMIINFEGRWLSWCTGDDHYYMRFCYSLSNKKTATKINSPKVDKLWPLLKVNLYWIRRLKDPDVMNSSQPDIVRSSDRMIQGSNDWVIKWSIQWSSDRIIEWSRDQIIKWSSTWTIEWINDWTVNNRMIQWLKDPIIEWMNSSND